MKHLKVDLGRSSRTNGGGSFIGQVAEPVKISEDACRSWILELTDREIHLLARLSRDRGLYAECEGADLDALQKLGLLQWFDARSSTTPFKEDLRAFLKLHGVSGRIDYAWLAAVENWRELVGPEVSARVDAIDERAAISGPFTVSRAA
jgi:hypothetical protein